MGKWFALRVSFRNWLGIDNPLKPEGFGYCCSDVKIRIIDH